MKCLSVVDNTQVEGKVSQIFDEAASLYFIVKKRETFFNCIFDVDSSLNKMRTKT